MAMSEVDNDEDLEFLTAFEDELYNDTWSTDSDDSLDSELEAELYQSVHFASSVIETPTGKSKGKESPDGSNQPSSLGPLANEHSTNDNQTDEDGEKRLDGECGENVKDVTFKSFYPEVELVFSKDGEKSRVNEIKKSAAAKLFQLDDDKSDVCSSGSTDHNEWGLIAADLMPPSKAKMRNNVRCFNCNERGHRTFECTESKKSKICWLCGGLDHLRKRCPNDLCYNCSQPGHQAKNCRKPRCRAEDTCNRCHAYGHYESFCPDRWRQYHLTTKQGNIIRPTGADKRRVYANHVFCYNCGEQGHFGHECVEETHGFMDTSFPFVVKYDRFTSNPARNFTKDFHANDNTRRHLETARNENEKRDRADSRSRKKKKREKSDDVVNGRCNSSKRRKLDVSRAELSTPRDNWSEPRDDGGNVYTNDNYDDMETFTDFGNVKTEFPRALMSIDVPFMKPKTKKIKKKKKRRNLLVCNETQSQFRNEQNQSQVERSKLENERLFEEKHLDNETAEIKKIKGKAGQKKRKAMKRKKERIAKREQQNHQQRQQLSNANTHASFAPLPMPSLPTENGELNRKKGKKRKRNDLFGEKKSLSSPASLQSFTNPNSNAWTDHKNLTHNSQDRRVAHLVNVPENAPRKFKKAKRKDKNKVNKETRKGFFNYPGFL